MITNQGLSKSEIEDKFGLKIIKVLSAEFFIAHILSTDNSYTKDSYYYTMFDKKAWKIVNAKESYFGAWYCWLKNDPNVDIKYRAMVERLRKLIGDNK